MGQLHGYGHLQSQVITTSFPRRCCEFCSWSPLRIRTRQIWTRSFFNGDGMRWLWGWVKLPVKLPGMTREWPYIIFIYIYINSHPLSSYFFRCSSDRISGLVESCRSEEMRFVVESLGHRSPSEWCGKPIGAWQPFPIPAYWVSIKMYFLCEALF